MRYCSPSSSKLSSSNSSKSTSSKLSSSPTSSSETSSSETCSASISSLTSSSTGVIISASASKSSRGLTSTFVLSPSVSTQILSVSVFTSTDSTDSLTAFLLSSGCDFIPVIYVAIVLSKLVVFLILSILVLKSATAFLSLISDESSKSTILDFNSLTLVTLDNLDILSASNFAIVPSNFVKSLDSLSALPSISFDTTWYAPYLSLTIVKLALSRSCLVLSDTLPYFFIS